MEAKAAGCILPVLLTGLLVCKDGIVLSSEVSICLVVRAKRITPSKTALSNRFLDVSIFRLHVFLKSLV